MSPHKENKTARNRALLLRKKLEESEDTIRELKRERELLIKALDGAGVGVILEDKKRGEYQVLNKSVSRITGYAPEELSSSREWSRKLHTDRLVGKKAAGFAGRFGKGRRSAVEDFLIKTRAGKDRIVRVRAMPFRHDSSGGKKVLNIITDVTEEADVRNNLEYYRDFSARLFDHSVDGICVLDSKMRISHLNRSLLTNSGFRKKDLIGKSGMTFVPPEFKKEVKRLFKQAIDHGFIPTTRMQLFAAKGRRADVELSGVRVDDPTRNRHGVMISLHDISVKLSREHMLKRLSSIVYNSPVPIIELDMGNRIRYANLAFEKFFGYSRRNVVGKHVRFLHHRPSYSEVEKEIQRSLKRMGQWMGELWLRKKDRSSFPAEVMKSATYDSEGVQTGYTIFYCDMTQRKKAEEARAERTDKLERLVDKRTNQLVQTEKVLRESEQKYHMTIDSMDDAVHLVDRDLRIILANKSLTKWSQDLGLGKDLIGRTVFEAFPFLSSKIRKEYERVLRSGKTLITEESNVINGREVITETRKIPAFEEGKVRHVITIVRDISAQRAVLKSLKHRVELEKPMTYISAQYIDISSDEVDGTINRALNVLGEFTGVDRAQVYLMSRDRTSMRNTYEWCAQRIKPQREELREIAVERLPWTMERLRRLENIPVTKVEDLPKKAAAERRRFKKQNIKSALGIPMALEGSLLGFFSFDSVHSEKTWAEEDIAVLKTVGEIFSSALQRKRTEEALRESEATALALLDGVKEPMALLNADGTIIAANEVVAKNVGKTVDQLVGLRILDYFPSKAAKFRSGKIKEVLRTKEPLRFEDDTTDRIHDTTIQPIFDDKGSITRLAIIAHDITDRKNLEQQLFLSAKLASLGGFVARIAHEINNPLASIKLDIERMKKKAELAKDCENLLGTISRISHIVDNLLKYARGRKTKLKPNNVENTIKSALELVRERFAEDRKNIITRFKCPKALVFSDFGQLQQVFLNLAVNACEALEERGTLEIHTSRVPASKDVRVVFRDNGKGISKQDLGRVLDPFFTTRASGTGLGLSISHRIIANHNGRIELKSALGKGTEVIITLPASKAETGRKKKQRPR